LLGSIDRIVLNISIYSKEKKRREEKRKEKKGSKRKEKKRKEKKRKRTRFLVWFGIEIDFMQ